MCGLIVVIGLLLGLTRGLQRPATALRLQACDKTCDWNALDMTDLTIGDLLLALGSPTAVSFTQLGRPAGSVFSGAFNFRETLYYPVLALEIPVEIRGNDLRVSPTSRQKIQPARMTTVIPQTAQSWRGFASLCRYYPLLPELCARY